MTNLLGWIIAFLICALGAALEFVGIIGVAASVAVPML